MQKICFNSFVKAKLPIKEKSVFGDLSELPYLNLRKLDSTQNIDLNNLDNDQILRIIKNTSVSLNYQYFCISTYQINPNRVVLFTQKTNGIKSTLSQIFIDSAPFLIFETDYFPILSSMIEDYQNNPNTNLPELLKNLSHYEYR